VVNEYNPLVSIVLLSLLRWDDTLRCLESLYFHTDATFEIIIVDMGADPKIVAKLQEAKNKWPHIRLVLNHSNVGTSRGRNQGAAVASGQFLLFLDNDTEVTSGWLSPLLARIAGPNIAACGAKIITANREVLCAPVHIRTDFEKGAVVNTGLEFNRSWPANAAEVAQEDAVLWYPTTCLLVKRDAFSAVGGFDESLFLCEEDKDLAFSLKEAGYRILYVPASEVIHHNHRPEGEYVRIRNDLKRIFADIRYFREKWRCRPFIRHSRSYLRQQGLGDAEIDRLKRFSLLNEVLEDIPKPLELRELIVTITNRCNHRCAMCYYHERLNSRATELDLMEYRNIAASLGTLEILWISGGEPFLRRDLTEICGHFVAHNPLRHIFIPTNGSQPASIIAGVQHLVDTHPDIRVTVMFSLEGLPASHDVTHDKAGAFASVEESIKRLNFLRVRLLRRQRRFGILLNTVVSQRNLHEIIDLMDYVRRNIPVDSHLLSPMRGQPKDASLGPPSGKAFAELVRRADSQFDYYAGRTGLKPKKLSEIQMRRDRRHNLWITLLDGGSLPFTCQAGRRIGVLEPNGDVRLCEEFPVVGNVRDTGLDFRQVWFSPAADASRQAVPGCRCTHACFIGASEGSA